MEKYNLKIKYFVGNEDSGIITMTNLDEYVYIHLSILEKKILNTNTLIIENLIKKECFKFSYQELKEKVLKNRLLTYNELLYKQI